MFSNAHNIIPLNCKLVFCCNIIHVKLELTEREIKFELTSRNILENQIERPFLYDMKFLPFFFFWRTKPFLLQKLNLNLTFFFLYVEEILHETSDSLKEGAIECWILTD